MKQAQHLLFVFLLLATVSAHAQVGIGTPTPNASAQLDVSSTTKGFLPPRMTQAQRDAITNPVEGLMIYNTTSKKPSFYDGKEWKNFDGTSTATPLAIGDSYEGGIIAYILQPGDPGYIPCQTHGLIAAAFDQSTGAPWGCDGKAIPGSGGRGLGTGNQNTINIMAGCAKAGIAARLCGNLELNGYSDWYLPSRDELVKLYLNRVAVGGFAGTYYRSSSQAGRNAAWHHHFGNGGGGPSPNPSTSRKLNLYHVRAVRSF